MSDALKLDGGLLSLEDVVAVAVSGRSVVLSEQAYDEVRKSRRVVDEVLSRGETAYGINTGFGKLSDVRIAPDQLESLQRNLVRSHACGIGEPLPEDEVRAMLLLRANVLAKGLSGVRPVIEETLIALLNHRVHPVIPARGSVGASGDLAPLAHLALVLMGEGEVFFKRSRVAASAALKAAGITPLTLAAKEGLALLNGTQAMAGVGALAIARAHRVAELFDLAGAMSLEALRGTPAAFDARIHEARPYSGQIVAA